MAAGLPTVAFDTPVAREYLGVHGLYAVRGDVDSLAEKLETALMSTELGPLLRQRAIQHFDWLKAGQQITEAYQRLVEDPQAHQATLGRGRSWVDKGEYRHP
jgi:glycosyltransferase involved in cell wall biosynthesis